MMSYALLAVVAVAAWCPVAVFFFRRWRERKNPISLAIVTGALLEIWEIVGRIWAMQELVSTRELIIGLTALSAVVALFFNVTFVWARRKFQDERGPRG